MTGRALVICCCLALLCSLTGAALRLMPPSRQGHPEGEGVAMTRLGSDEFLSLPRPVADAEETR